VLEFLPSEISIASSNPVSLELGVAKGFSSAYGIKKYTNA